MSITAQYFRDQVQLLTGNDQIANKVITWLSRACQELGLKAMWRQQARSAPIGGNTQSTTITSQWVSLTNLATSNFVQMHYIEYSTTVPMIRMEAQDFYANYQGLNASYSADPPSHYAIPAWTTSGNTTTQYLVPYFAAYPLSATATTAFTAYFHAAPDPITTSDGTNWMMDKYTQTVLSRVMCYACLYLKDPQGYLAWKSRYENGVRDMVMTETTSVAGSPVRRSATPENIFRGGANG